jgi:hypothetical protein
LLHAQLLNEFQRQAASCSFIPVDCARQEDKVWPEHGLYERKWDGRGFVNDHQFGLRKLVCIAWLNVLDRLSMLFEYIHPHDGVIEL